MLKKVIKKNFNKEFGIVVLAALIMLFIKLFFSYHVYGSNDITYYIFFSKIIEKFGTFKLYALTSLANHPPLLSWIIKFVAFIQHKTQLGFPYLYRSLLIIADFLSIIIIWKLSVKYLVKNRVLICLICIFNPVNFFICAYHGNTDPLFIFFLLLAFDFIEDDKIVFAGMIYGLSLCIKIVPVIFIPVFFYFLRTRKSRVVFFMSSLLLPLVVYLPYLAYDYHSMLKDIFYYNSLNGIWGIGHILQGIASHENNNIFFRKTAYGLFKWHIASFRIMFFALQIVLIKYLSGRRPLNLIELAFLTFGLFLAITPGFGIQYLSWLPFFAIVIYPVLGSIYVVLGGFFLYRVYVFWGGGKAPYYANSMAAGQWGGWDGVLDIVLWLLVVVMLLKFIIDRKALDHAQ